MKHYGDITKIDGGKVEPVWVLCGGSPCQDLSVAGLRKGLQHSALGDGETTRSGLFMEQIRIAKEMRANDKANGRTGKSVRCRWMVWENVQGAYSSGTPKGEDFRIVLEEISKIADESAVIPGPPNGKWPYSGCILADEWSIAWMLHDAQFHGVPQRRRRVCVCADFNGQSAPRILFELRGKTVDTESDQTFTDSRNESRSEILTFTKGLSRNSEQSRETGQGVTEDSERCIDSSSYTLKIRGGREVDSNGRKAGKGALIQEELSGTLGVSQDQTLITTAYGICSDGSNSMKSDNPHSGIYEADTSRTLDLNGGNPSCNQGGMAIVQGVDFYNGSMTGDKSKTLNSAATDSDHIPCVVAIEGNGTRESHKGDGYKESDTMYTLNATEQHAVAYRKTGHPQNSEQGQGWEETTTSDTLNVSDNTETRTPIVVVETKHKHVRRNRNERT